MKHPQQGSPLRIILLVVLLLPISGCIMHWPDAPRLETAAALDQASAQELQRMHPGAKLASPVYVRSVESAPGSYEVVSRHFLFMDASGNAHRARLDASGRWEVVAVEFADALPQPVHDRFFAASSGMAPGGRLQGRVWRYRDPATGMIRYEFVYLHQERRGLGLIEESGTLVTAQHLRSADAP